MGTGFNTIPQKRKLSTALLAQRLSALHNYYTNTIRLDRPGHDFKHRIWQNIHTQCALCLGYCLTYHHKAQHILDPFLDLSLIIHFFRYHIAAKHSRSTNHGFLLAAKKVTQWWDSTLGGQHNSLKEAFALAERITPPGTALQDISKHVLKCCTAVVASHKHLQLCKTSFSIYVSAALLCLHFTSTYNTAGHHQAFSQVLQCHPKHQHLIACIYIC